MKHKGLVRYLFLFFLFIALAVDTSAQQKKRLTFDQIYRGAETQLFMPLPNITGWEDDTHYLEMRRKEGPTAEAVRPSDRVVRAGAGEQQGKLYSVDAKSGKEKEALPKTPDLNQFKDIVGSEINVNLPASANEARTKLIYVKEKDLYFLNTETKEFKRLTQTPSEEKNPTLSPDGNYVAFTRDNNLLAIDVTAGKEYQYTTDGAKFIYNGYASWVYFEEILGRPSRYRAFWWSPDNKKLAFMRFDDSKVPAFPLYNSDGVHGFLEETPYPKPGDPNPEVRVGVVPVTGGSIVWADFNEKDDQYFGTPFWTPDNKELWVQWMNRGQDTLTIYSVDPQTGKKQLVYTEYQPSWLEWFDRIEFLKNNKGFIVKTDKDGWMHLYLYAMDGALKNRITEGKWQVSDVLLVDQDDDLIYFTGKKEASTRSDLYRVKMNGKDLTRLTFGDYTHSVRLSPHGSYFITTYSNVSTPQKITLCSGKGKVIRELGDSKGKEFDNYELAETELVYVKTPDGYNLPTTITLPLDLEASKKYPVLISIYGGPNSGTVSDGWKGMGNQWWALEGMIQVSVDHRGSGHFGKEGVALMHRNLGKWEMNDYIECVKWLRAKPYVDEKKVCITGSSYGGYETCLALTYGADYFTHGVAGSSVTDWNLYDTHYTERYMDTPAENPEGYKNSSAMAFADRYKGLIRIVHGTMDDNVHMQNSIQLIDKLEELGKHFEFAIYPGGRHGWGGAKAVHNRVEAARFYYRYLLEKPFPEQDFAKLYQQGPPVRPGGRYPR
jgi:dipeptidyl-peptidase-4